MDFATLREQYQSEPLEPSDVDPDPIAQLRTWFAAWSEVAPREPSAAVLATAGADGRPAARTVLVRGIDERGCTFFTNYESRKGTDLTENPWASLLFQWVPVLRQVELVGSVQRIDPEESDAYFAGRPRGSQLAAWASAQSRAVASRADLEAAVAAVADQYGDGPIPRPPHWGGFRLVPDTVELWQGRPDRLHDRLRYERAGSGAAWRIVRLNP
ncbi:MAG: pyridoxamine 5'-phosphate oxidase [Actinomycetota bacterium]|nr:pyridoxamine 5'-phosphate oxidase [Actinomycetota bacterium]